jgi:hypothetical protein
MKLRKKPAIIEANQYTDPENPPKGCHKKENGVIFVKVGYREYRPLVDDWVCTENGVDYFVLSDDYIKEHFEEVEK